MAKKTSKKAAATRKAGASKKKATTRKKAAAKKAPAGKSSSAAKKTPAKKKVSSKKTAAKKKTTTKKKTTKASKAAADKKTAAKNAPKKAASEPKASSKKTTVKKTAPAKKPASSATNAPENAKPASPTNKKKQAGANGEASPAPPRSDRRAASGPDRFRSVYKGGGSTGREAAARLAAAAGLQGVRSSAQAEAQREKKYRKLTKTPFSPEQLAEFRELLIIKRKQLLGDVTSMESEALGGNGGSLSHLPQHMADQGSDTFDQSLNLDLAASQRGLLKEIDDALDRIDRGLYGICELLGKPIKLERLRHTPWARFSIEAAREIEKNPFLLRKNDED